MKQFRKYIEDMAAKSLRCVAFAFRPYEYKDIPSEEERETWILPEDDLILTGIVGLKVFSCKFPVDCLRFSYAAHLIFSREMLLLGIRKR